MSEADTLADKLAEVARDGRDAAPNGSPTSAADDSAERPLLVIHNDDLPATAEALRDLFARGGRFFERGVPAQLMLPESGIIPRVVQLNANSVVIAAHRLCRPVVMQHGNPQGKTLQNRIASLYLNMTGSWNLPSLNGITTAPILGDDGSIRTVEGYDAATGLWATAVPSLKLPDRPSRDDAAAALMRLRREFLTFPFKDAARHWDGARDVEIVDLQQSPKADESALLVGLLTCVCRPCLWLTPGLIINAPAISGSGSGKGLLVRALCAIAFGLRPDAIAPGHDRNELDKRLVAAAIEARPAIFLDNFNAMTLRSNTLASLITERPARVRMLGESRLIELNAATFIAITGNGLSVSEDLARRFLFCELDARLEDPETRSFAPRFVDGVLNNRAELLGAVLTIWRWARQNAQALKHGKPLGSFEQWAEWCRDPLLALGCADPVERIAAVKAADQHRRNVVEIFAVWFEHHQDRPVKQNEMADKVHHLLDPQNRGRQYIAAKLDKLVGARVGGFVFERQSPAGKWGVATYTVNRLAESEAGSDNDANASATSEPQNQQCDEPNIETTSTGFRYRRPYSNRAEYLDWFRQRFGEEWRPPKDDEPDDEP